MNMQKLLLTIGLICICGFCVHASVPQTINKTIKRSIMKQEIRDKWMFRQEGSTNQYSAEVPGCAHTDLMKNGIIADPYYGINEQSLQWIGEKNWIYETTFNVSTDILKKDSVELVFEGLDTYAMVTLNDCVILKANNMFRTWRVQCKQLLLPQNNRLSIRFRNVFEENLPKYHSAPYVLQAYGNNDQADIKIAMYSRKAQFHYGWDWGPRLITCGIWRPVYLEGWNNFKIADVHIQQKDVTAENATIISVINIQSSKKQTVDISIAMDKMRLNSKQVKLQPGANTVNLSSLLLYPNLWWTNGLGSHSLYHYRVEIADDAGNMDYYSTPIGVRSLEVVRDKDSMGISMLIKLNGVPVFMKGANYIPQDNFQNRVTKAKYEFMIKSAADANMNMLRVWGGGIYEDNLFYELCDQYGILVWQEMIFACAMYPADSEFLENVRQEVVDNVKRIRNYSCVAMYCGNNENEAGWFQWGWKELYNETVQRNFEKNAYKLFYKVIPSALREADSTRYYHPTSPIAGIKGVANNEGDIHYWGVWHGKEPFESYNSNIARFVSEYGFQSYPELSTVAKYAAPEKRELHSDVMLSHQRCMADERKDKEYGNRLIQTYMDKWYRTPKDFNSYLYVSQVLQAEGVKLAMEAHRRAKPFCMGSLYWQIDDCWPVASWSSIDYYGRWKALHYAARKSFASILISPVLSDSELKIFIVNDSLKNIDANLDVSILDFNGANIYNQVIEVQLQSNSSSLGLSIPREVFSKEKSLSRMVCVCSLSQKNNILADAINYFTLPKLLDLEKPLIKYSIQSSVSGFSVTLKTNTLAKNVYVICADDRSFLSDNYFDLIPGKDKTINVTTSLTQKEFEESLKIMSLVDSY